MVKPNQYWSILDENNETRIMKILQIDDQGKVFYTFQHWGWRYSAFMKVDYFKVGYQGLRQLSKKETIKLVLKNG
jgi:hypothetical protein